MFLLSNLAHCSVGFTRWLRLLSPPYVALDRRQRYRQRQVFVRAHPRTHQETILVVHQAMVGSQSLKPKPIWHGFANIERPYTIQTVLKPHSKATWAPERNSRVASERAHSPWIHCQCLLKHRNGSRQGAFRAAKQPRSTPAEIKSFGFSKCRCSGLCGGELVSSLDWDIRSWSDQSVKVVSSRLIPGETAIRCDWDCNSSHCNRKLV